MRIYEEQDRVHIKSARSKGFVAKRAYLTKNPGLVMKKASADDLWRFAKICRVANVMRPYLEVVE
jgi:hypothetical protein